MGSLSSQGINDVKFLAEATSLSEGKLLTLLEDDFDHIVEAISDIDLTKARISLELFTKLTIFRETKNTCFDLEEKAYVSDCISIHYPAMFRESHYSIDRAPLKERDGQYYLVLLGMFPEFIIRKQQRNGAPPFDHYKGLTKTVFRSVNRENLANHIDDWVDLLYYVKKYCWS